MLNPVRIYGTWDEGIVLDNHMLKSVFLGYDENGKEQFENTRTEIGELIYKFKYQKDKSCLPRTMDLIRDILDKWNLKEKIDITVRGEVFISTKQFEELNEQREILGEIVSDDIYIDETTYIDNLGRPVKVCFLKNEALLTEYQGRIYKCDDPIKAFGWDSGEFKYERLWDFISEPYELYMRDKKELQRKCPKLYDYIKEVVEWHKKKKRNKKKNF